METIKPRRSVVKRQKREAAKQAFNASGATLAKLNDVPTSPRKMRLVVDLVRGKRVNEALAILKFQSKQGAQKIQSLLLTSISDWSAKNPEVNIEDADLYIKDIFVDGGRMLKRMRPAPQGRGYRVRKRSNHITMVLGSLANVAELKAVAKAKEEEPKKEEKKASKPKKESKKSDK
ncbi:MAG: 50S ribosomal protein L22 [Cytophagaceae bacterium]|jgi:large subunit ribosomal protein L22|nr:50S ribosomal protein L22 [Cytophagaceae bacterium]